MANTLNRAPSLSILITEESKLLLSSVLREDTRQFRLMSKKDALGATAEKLRDIFAEENVEIEGLHTMADILRALYRHGYFLAYTLLGCRAKVDEFREYARECLATEDPIYEPPLVDINIPADNCFPFELLPLLSSDVPKIERFHDVQPAAALFPGFRTIIRRTSATTPLPQAVKLRGTPKVPSRLFRYGSMEANLFIGLRDVLELRAPWPEYGTDPETALHAFGDLVFEAGTPAEPTPDQIQHFACHYDVGSGPARGRVQFAPEPPVRELELELDDLIGEFGERTPSDSDTKPLVFMNACASAAISTDSILSLPRLFLDNRNPVYIGTQCRLSEPVAAWVADRFYHYFLKASNDNGAADNERAGMALHLAKWDLLQRHRNPAGMIYTLYGDPNVCIERTMTTASSGAGDV